MSQTPPPPVAEKRPVDTVLHGDRRTDEYAWLRDRDDPAVIAYLEVENAYAEAMTAHLGGLRERVYEEIVARIQETDQSAPVPDGPWEYYSRTVEDLQYPILCRRPRGGGEESVILDENLLAEGHEYTRVGDAETSPDRRLLAYTVDHSGAERFTLRIRDMQTGVDLDDVVEDVYYSLAWSSDSRSVVYTRPDTAMRPYQVWRHDLGTPTADDALVLQEDDEHFFAGVERTRSGRFVVVTLESQVTSEVHLLDGDDLAASPVLVARRRHGVEYRVDHHPGGDRLHGDQLYVVTNEQARNFRLMRVPLTQLSRWDELIPPREEALLKQARTLQLALLPAPDLRGWEEVIATDADVKLDAVDVFAGFAALFERRDATRAVRWFLINHGHAHSEQVSSLVQPEAVSTVSPGENREFGTAVLRYEYTSLVTPPSDIDHDLREDRRSVVKQMPVLGGYDPENYVTERHWATADDGERIPISIVYRRGLSLDRSAPCLLYGYGAYEISRDPAFSSLRLSLVDRGFVYAIAHVRGGGELGRRWYDEGKLLRKRNTFTDFIACGDHLVAEGFTDSDRLAIRGGSAGGLLIGAVVNMRPDLAAAAIAEVPFVDSLNSMLDPSLPLTVVEYDEWGNPQEPDTYAYMRSYAPYDNVAAVDHPALLVLGGLNDPRVGFWEPAKWVARLRERNTGARPILLRTEMGAGHAGPSGRYETWRREAFIMSWLLDRLPGWEERTGS
jgi:oligopeptidase B